MVYQKNQIILNYLHHITHDVQHHYTKENNTIILRISTGQIIHSNTSTISTKSNKKDESILQHIPEQNSIPVLFKQKIENNDTSNEENDNRISQQYSLYNLYYIKTTSFKTIYQNNKISISSI